MEEKENKQNKIREIYLDDLPKKNGVGNNKERKTIDWINGIGHKINGVYDNISFEFLIIDYNSKNSRLTLKYNNKNFDITTGHLCECKIRKILGLRTIDFKFKIGQTLKDNKRDITIINKEYKYKVGKSKYTKKEKWYKYKCNKCGNEDWIIEGSLTEGRGCNTCCNAPRKLMLGVNTLYDTDKWILEYMVNPELAKENNRRSTNKIDVKCPICGRIKDKQIQINSLVKSHSIGCPCGDGFSYPAKLVFNLLEQLNTEFKTEYSPLWCKFNFRDYIRKGYYDFVFKLNNKKYIIETDGDLGHGNVTNLSKITAEESIFIDNEKDRLANEHNIEVIRIDCRKSELEYIKQNILNSKLNELFDLNKIDWLKAERFALSNLVKKVCDYKRENPMVTAKEISEIMGINSSTINKYLKRGAKINWCYYNPLDVNKIKIAKAIEKTSKQVEVFKDNISLGIFKSISELQRKSEEVFGVKLFDVYIINVCKGRREEYHGFTFKYVDKANDIDNISKSA